MARLAVSAVTCRQAEMRTPFSGSFLMNSLRMICRTFIDWFAHSMRFFPRSASSMFLMSQLIAAVDMVLLINYSPLAFGSWLLIVARFLALGGYDLLCSPHLF